MNTTNRPGRQAERSSERSSRPFTRRPEGARDSAFSHGTFRIREGGDRGDSRGARPSSRGHSDGASRPSFSRNRSEGGDSRSARPSSSRGYEGNRPRPSGDRGGRSFSGGGDRGGRSFSPGGNRGRSGGGRGGRKQKTFDVSQYINRNPVVADKEPEYVATHTFDTFEIDDRIKKAIKIQGFTAPSPIQDQIIPHILDGKDVIGLANTGTGKTAAFLIPLLHATLNNEDMQTLILTPTRELAIQIQDELRKLTRDMRIFSTVCVGGANIRPQIMGLKKKNHFIIGTPGRVMDLIERKSLKRDGITTVVLDEADRMLDMGFIHDMRSILQGVRDDRHMLFFSATMSKEIELMVNDFLRDPVIISVRKKDITNSIAQDVVPHGHHDKFETLLKLLSDKEQYSRVLIFGAMKHSVEKLAKELTTHGILSDSIHGNKSQGARQIALKRFKSGQVRVLVATDVAARGIHIDDVSHVINYDLPAAYEDYVHRIGRTGRGGKNGKALTFVHQD